MQALFPTSVLALSSSPTPTGGLELLPLLMGLLGGLALFLFGLGQMSKALKIVAGDRLKLLLGRLTSHRLAGLATGAFVTAVIQSSSVTTVLVVGFVSAGLMTLTQSVAVIMGANVGATLTTQIIAFPITRYSLLLVAAGFALSLTGRNRGSRRQEGEALMGLGLIFFGMGLMGDAMAPLRSFPPFLDAMVRLEDPWLGILAGAVFTALVQSSSATSGIVIVLAGQGLLSLPAGIALVLGANVGTCVTALLAAIGKSREALRAAVVHVLFNLLGVVLWVGFIGSLAELVVAISPTSPQLVGTARLAAEAPRQIANAHTLFNVANALLLIGFSPLFARASHWLVPESLEPTDDTDRPRYLDRELMGTPSLALDRVRLEILHLGDRVKDMLVAVPETVIAGDRQELYDLEEMDDTVDALHGAIVTYLGQLSQRELSEPETAELLELMEAAHSLENIGDIIETNLVTRGLRRLDEQVLVSESTRRVIEEFHVQVVRAFDSAILAVAQKNRRAAMRVVGMKAEINRLAERASLHQAKRLVAAEPRRLPSYAVEMDVLENLKRVFYFSKRIARSVLGEEAAVAEAQSP